MSTITDYTIDQKVAILEANGYKVGAGFSWETTNCLPYAIWEKVNKIAPEPDFYPHPPEVLREVRKLIEGNKVRCEATFQRIINGQ